MAKIFICECGVVIKGRDDDDLVVNAQRHAREVALYVLRIAEDQPYLKFWV